MLFGIYDFHENWGREGPTRFMGINGIVLRPMYIP